MRLPTLTPQQAHREDARAFHEALWEKDEKNSYARRIFLPSRRPTGSTASSQRVTTTAAKRTETDAVFIARQLRSEWLTMHEMCGLLRKSEPMARQAVQTVSQRELVFRRTRKTAFKQPYEYRILPRAINVQGEQ